jgi:hypothetical protein
MSCRSSAYLPAAMPFLTNHHCTLGYDAHTFACLALPPLPQAADSTQQVHVKVGPTGGATQQGSGASAADIRIPENKWRGRPETVQVRAGRGAVPGD